MMKIYSISMMIFCCMIIAGGLILGAADYLKFTSSVTKLFLWGSGLMTAGVAGAFAATFIFQSIKRK